MLFSGSDEISVVSNVVELQGTATIPELGQGRKASEPSPPAPAVTTRSSDLSSGVAIRRTGGLENSGIT